MTAEVNGPYQVNYLTVDGFAVPDIQVNTAKNPQGEITSYELVLDRRLSIRVPPSLFENVAWFVANAMAVAAGYSCHGENSVANPNKYRVRVCQLGGEK